VVAPATEERPAVGTAFTATKGRSRREAPTMCFLVLLFRCVHSTAPAPSSGIITIGQYPTITITNSVSHAFPHSVSPTHSGNWPPSVGRGHLVPWFTF
jgi:hypothetical protein